MKTSPAVTIHYCSQCNWLLRAAWMAQELLHTFSTDLASVTLVPGTGGIYQVTVDDVVIWDRKIDGGFPEAAALKQRLRDRCFPERSLGHVDNKGAKS
ncbi:SelT/SelW/SelH family protein [Serratia proteamaculans]|uniref:SelT/SelW/SelH family protein n=1 Tax=Serratia proteamaculans TaxID=28151 RepID=A0A7U0RLN9_SERPR|nr:MULTISPECIES: SelT/SelW/SelH family protein [Serratia]HCV65030.1 SelT/SelW/SelH family protein [Serratia sp. (in: enterobacteria)]MBO1501864.1 SelT/SelW/SelH family protein [Serratia proteamaculans]MDW5508713.1 SelT/SelW/SelH family protein [Serratia proteamaculans]NWA71196.1 SelT/SelW/SelH family protein [Serratia proteamaculans]QQX53044.1 SelT/SelW/SelH family protein [Serratia proteamaculans]